MTTTSNFQIKPDYYENLEKCVASNRDKKQTNPRYSNFTQTHFTAGDEDQFQTYRYEINGNICNTSENISLVDNVFIDLPFEEWSGYKDLNANDVTNTFRYIFNKFKKGIFIKIVNNELKVFLPFSNSKFINEWSDRIKVDPKKYNNIYDFLRYVSDMEGRFFNKNRVNAFINTWYANNSLLRHEYPINEGDTNVSTVKNMLEELCRNRQIPDIELFLNRRDYPLLSKFGHEPYYNIWDRIDKPLVSHDYKKFVPILSMSGTDKFADVLIPTHEDWARVQSLENKWFPRSCRSYIDEFNNNWESKKPTAVFRGGTTGTGVTIDTNPRLKVSNLSYITPIPSNGIPYLDAGITNWNVRPRKIMGNPYLQTIDIKSMPFPLVSRLTPLEQSNYKYVIHIEGHTSAFRLSYELSMNSVILLVDSKWKIWYTNMLIPYKHYIPIKADLSDLIDKIEWCRDHDNECKEIAYNAKIFYDTYLCKKGILDYMQKIFVDLKDEIGVYLYNIESPLQIQVKHEQSIIDSIMKSYPTTDKTVLDINRIPNSGRCFGLLKGMQWIYNLIYNTHNFEAISKNNGQIFSNKLGTVDNYSLANFSFAVKESSDYQKIQEHIHETFVGLTCINKILNNIPNFMYIFGSYKKSLQYKVVSEFIYGESLQDFINSKEFNLRDYLFILVQLCLCLHVAQNQCCFVHYDLTPWNIIIQKLNKEIEVEYVIDYNKVIKIKTSIVPIIIDYGKSHVSYESKHYGFVNMYKFSTVQDIFTILITSLYQIINNRYSNIELNKLFVLSNFLSNSQFYKDTFNNYKDLNTFLHNNKTYSKLISSDKKDLEKLTPMDLFNYINKNFGYLNFSIQVTDTYYSIMNKSNAKQVFEYVLSKSIAEQLETYSNVFNSLLSCTIPQPKNLFFIYYAAQSLEDNLISVRDNMMYFLKENAIMDSSKYEDLFNNTIRFLHKFYSHKLKNTKEKEVYYSLSEYFNELIPCPYKEDSFLTPNYILELLEKYNKLTDYTDLSDYKQIIQYILLNKGKYMLKKEDKYFYIKVFDKLLKTKEYVMKNNSSNYNTLRQTSKDVYSLDLKFISENKCKAVEKYSVVYNNILNML